MEKLVTKLDTNLGAALREQLDSNFQKIQNGVDGQSDALNKRIQDMLGDVPLQDQNEVTQARIDANGKQYQTMKGRLDSDQLSAETALEEERKTGLEVQEARENNQNITYPNLKQRLDSQENDLTKSMNEKIAQISANPETFSNVNDLKNKYPNGKAGLFVTADTGHKYIWSNNTWTDAGVYQGIGISDAQKADIVQSALDYNSYIAGADLINGSVNNISPYRVANTDTTATFMQNTLGKNWARFSGSKKKYIGGIVDVDLTGSNNYRIWQDMAVDFLVHNNASQALPLTIIINAYDADNKFVGSVNPVLNGARNIKNTFISSNQTKKVNVTLPSFYNMFPNNYAALSKVSFNFVYAGDDLDVDFMITELNLNATNYAVNSATTLQKNNKIAINNFLNQDDFVKNGDFNVDTELPIYANSGVETISYLSNINGKNWVNVVAKDNSKSGKGFAFDYDVSDADTRWRANQKAIVSTNIIKRATNTPLHLSVYVYVYDANNVTLASYTPFLSLAKNTNMVDGVETLIKFKIPKLSELSAVPAKVRVLVVSDVASEELDILVGSVSVRANGITPLATNVLSDEERQNIQSFIDNDSYVKGGKLITRDTGAYSIATGKETINVESIGGKNWVHYVATDSQTPYKGFQTYWRLDGEYQERLTKPVKVIFDVQNNQPNQLLFTLNLFDEDNKRVGIYTPTVLGSNNVYHADLVLPAPNDIIVVGAKTPVRAVLTFNDPVAANVVDFFISGLEIYPAPSTIANRTSIPEINITGDVSAMTKDVSCKVRLEYAFTNGEKTQMYADIAWQGNSSTAYPKKNYKIKLYEASDFAKKKKFTPFADMRKSSKFVLKANWIDSTHARNLVNSALVADMTATRDYIPSGLIGAENFAQVNGHPVNVYINGAYMGLYTFNTTKSSNLFNMQGDKANEISISAEVWSDATLFKTNTAALDETKDFSVNAPDNVTDDTRTSVNRLLTFVNSSSDTDFVQNINEYIDLSSMIDYFIFANVSQDTDGMGKNATYYTYDGKVWSAVMYDLDSTWGLKWSGDALVPYDENAISFRNNKLFNRISNLFKEQIKSRYKELRVSVLRNDVIINKFNQFINEIGEENYAKEQTRWPNLPSLKLTDEQQIREAVVQRLQAVDKQMDIL